MDPKEEKADRLQQIEQLRWQLQAGSLFDVAPNPPDEPSDRFPFVSAGSSCFSSGNAAWDQLLNRIFQPRNQPGRKTGALTEWFEAEPGQGVGLISLWAVSLACRDRGALVVVDPDQQFYPPAAVAWGIDLKPLILLRPKHSDTLWAYDQALRCPAVRAVWCQLSQLNDRWFRRFQLAVETSGCLAALVRPLRFHGRPSWADLQFIVRPCRLDRSKPGTVSKPCDSKRKPAHISTSSMGWQVELVRNRKQSYTGKLPTGPLKLTADLQCGTLQIIADGS